MSITLIIKSTRICNLRCSYCHDWRVKEKRISFEKLAKLLKKAISTENNVHFIWHGGEPLLLGIDWFKKVVFLQSEIRDRFNKFCSIQNSIQTNGVLLNEDWAAFFKKFNFVVGVSIDGPPKIHNRNRFDANGEDTYQKVLDGINILKNEEIRFGLLSVVTEDFIDYGADKIYDWLKTLKVPSIGLIPQRPDTEGLNEIRVPSKSSYYLPREIYADFLNEIIEKWWKDDGRGPVVREVLSLFKALINGKSSYCVYSGVCAGKYFGVDPNGDIYHCDKYIPEPQYKIGNIENDNFTFKNHKIELLQKKLINDEKQIEKSCKWYSFCYGGCPHDRHSNPMNNSTMNKSQCCGMKKVLSNLNEKILSSLPPSLV